MLLSVAFALAAPDAAAWQGGLDVEGRHMQILTGWALGNLAVGSVAAWQSDDPALRSFHGTNAAWNTVNLAIGGLGLAGVHRRSRRDAPDAASVAAQHRSLRTALAVNLGLDAVYMGSGVALMAFGGDTRGLDHRGVGAGLLLQGAFLATFDAAFLTAHRGVDRPSRLGLRPTVQPVAGTWTAGLSGRWGRP
jgi:hypothetical protein